VTGSSVLLRRIATLEAVLEEHAALVGRDFEGYRNHTYRVVNLCAAQSPSDPEQLEKMATAAAFHDLGIWTDDTFDYLEPSVRLATAHLTRAGRAGWIAEITAMIRNHHKVSPYRGDPRWLVEPFRRADWIDVTLGWRTFGLSRALITTIRSAWPSAGFHKRLVQLEVERLRTHPLRPLPMFKL
jgi:hypothetical protein